MTQSLATGWMPWLLIDRMTQLRMTIWCVVLPWFLMPLKPYSTVRPSKTVWWQSYRLTTWPGAARIVECLGSAPSSSHT